jgi:hypothetical protein
MYFTGNSQVKYIVKMFSSLGVTERLIVLRAARPGKDKHLAHLINVSQGRSSGISAARCGANRNASDQQRLEFRLSIRSHLDNSADKTTMQP